MLLKTVKIGMPEYKAIKLLAKKEGMLLQFMLTEAVRQYLQAAKEKQESMYAAGVR